MVNFRIQESGVSSQNGWLFNQNFIVLKLWLYYNFL
jgi:hypothetical protein